MLNALTNLQVEQRMQRLIGNNLFYASSSCLFLAFSRTHRGRDGDFQGKACNEIHDVHTSFSRLKL